MNDPNGPIPVWTLTGHTCITEAQFQAQPPTQKSNIACPNGGALVTNYVTGTTSWVCNGGPQLAFSQQYAMCLGLGFVSATGCDPAGLSQELVSDFLPGSTGLSATLAAANLVVQQQPGWDTVCASVSVASPFVKGWPAVLTSVAFDGICLLSQVFGGSQTNPTISLNQPQINGLAVTLNGIANPTTAGATISYIQWNFGDGSIPAPAWFPNQHTYAKDGTYQITVTAVDSNSLAQSAMATVTVASPPPSPPTGLNPTVK